MKPDPSAAQHRNLEIQCGQIDALRIYEVQKSELEQLAQGRSGSLFLNFGIFFLSTALAFIIALLTGTFSNAKRSTCPNIPVRRRLPTADGGPPCICSRSTTRSFSIPSHSR